MRVALFALGQSPDGGGVWQFSQWIVTRIGPHVPLHLFAPQTMLDEILRSQALPPLVTATAADRYLAQVRSGLIYRALEATGRGRIGGIRIPYYWRASERVRNRFYDGSVERSAMVADLKRHSVDVVHVPQQWFGEPMIAQRYPYVINPHDYQHEHLPQFFPREAIEDRRRVWYPVQRAAAAVVVHSLQSRDDALRFLDIPEERVFYAPYGPLATFPEVDEETAARTAETLRLPDSFVFYPARMWPHKNHVALLQALALLKRQRGLKIGCVFTDDGGSARDCVMAAAENLGIGGQVRIVGRVPPDTMGALYRLCTMVVVPSLFEQNSGPMLEALNLGKAIAVSNLPELIHSLGDGGLIFDRHSVEAMAAAIDQIISSPGARADLEARARRRRGQLSWQPFIETYRRAYAYAMRG